MHNKLKTLNPATVSSASVLDLIDVCLALKLMTPATLEQLKLERERLLNPEERIAEEKIILLWQHLSQHCDRPEFGLLVGQQINPQAKGVLASWVSQCANLEEALLVFKQHIALMNPSEQWQLHNQGEEVCLSFSFAQDKHYPNGAIERSMSALLTWGQALTGENIPLKKAQFTYSKPGYLTHYHETFGPQLEFNTPANTLVFNRDVLQRPVLSSNHYLKKIIKEKALEIFNALQDGAPLSLLILQLIKINLPKQKASIDILCDELSISRQTLYRKLKSEDTDFKSLLSQARQELALNLLKQNQHSMESIGVALGFKETSSFNKAFKRWFGVSPRDYIF